MISHLSINSTSNSFYGRVHNVQELTTGNLWLTNFLAATLALNYTMTIGIIQVWQNIIFLWKRYKILLLSAGNIYVSTSFIHRYPSFQSWWMFSFLDHILLEHEIVEISGCEQFQLFPRAYWAQSRRCSC